MAKVQTTAMYSKVDENGKLIGLPMDKAREIAPAIFAKEQAPTIKSRFYNFTSTEELIGHMQSLGYTLVMAAQSKTKGDLKWQYGTHIVGFQKDDLFISGTDGRMEARPTMVLINNHMGTYPVQGDLSLFRMVCANRLMVQEKHLGGFRDRHTKYTFQEVKDLVDSKLETLVQVTEGINKWSSRELNKAERFAFATEALALRTSGDRQPTQDELQAILTPLRTADKGHDLYRTFNVVQEHLINGGYEYNDRKARGIINPMLDVQINKQLWGIASKFYEKN